MLSNGAVSHTFVVRKEGWTPPPRCRVQLPLGASKRNISSAPPVPSLLAFGEPQCVWAVTTLLS